MSNPNDAPHPQEADGEPSSGNGSQRRRSGRFLFKMPADRPRSFYEAMPQGGLTELFSVAGLPAELRISYWIWLAGGLLGLLGGVIGLFGALVLFAFLPGVAILVLLLVLLGAALSGAQIVLAMKMKEGRERTARPGRRRRGFSGSHCHQPQFHRRTRRQRFGFSG